MTITAAPTSTSCSRASSHYYSGMLEWSRALGGVPILLHAADREWVTRPDPLVEHWDGETYALPGSLTLLRLGGHFDGGTVLHCPSGAEGRGALLSGASSRCFPTAAPSPSCGATRTCCRCRRRKYSGSWRRSRSGDSTGSGAPG